MATNIVPQKIVLKSTTKMSLNERFSTIQQRQPLGPQQVQATMAAQQQASQASRRLAQQMANRPTVQAALRLKKRSLQQRLGSGGVKARLQLGSPVQRGGVVQGRGRGTPRGYVQGGVYVSTSPRGQGLSRGRVMTRGTPGRGRIAYRGRGGGMRGMRGVRGMRRGIREGVARGRGSVLRWSGQPRGRGRGGGGRGLMRGRGTLRGRFIRGRGGPRGGRGRGRGGQGRGRGTQEVSREDLDNQLDAYMSKTKSYLDSELDEYMSHSAANDS